MSECDLSRDRAWQRQWYCGLHGVWFRDDGEHPEPDLCPVGEAIVESAADSPGDGTLIWLRAVLDQWSRADSAAHGTERRLRDALDTLTRIDLALTTHEERR